MSKEKHEHKETPQPPAPKKHTHSLWIRILAILAVISVLLGVVAAGLMSIKTSAAGSSLAGSPEYLPKRDVYFSDRVFSAGHEYVIPLGSEIMVEEGATLTIYGTLTIEGTLKNYGTVKVVQIDQPKDGDSNYEAGYISNRGTIINKKSGKIIVNNASMTNQKSGTLTNEGTIELSSKKDQTVLQNLAYTVGVTEEKGVITNSGTIIVKECAKAGIQNMSGAILKNTGTIKTVKSDYVKGTVSGNAVTISG